MASCNSALKSLGNQVPTSQEQASEQSHRGPFKLGLPVSSLPGEQPRWRYPRSGPDGATHAAAQTALPMQRPRRHHPRGAPEGATHTAAQTVLPTQWPRQRHPRGASDGATHALMRPSFFLTPS